MSFAVAVTNQVLTRLSGHRDTGLSDLGAYYTARTPTLGTGVVGGTNVNALTETTPTLVLYNAGPLSVYPMSLRTHITVIGTNATPTTDFWTVTMDVGNRYTSGGTTLTNQNENMLSAATSGAFVVVGGITATANTPRRRVTANLAVKTDLIEVIHDTMVINWGDTFVGSNQTLAANAAAPAYQNFSLPPCVIGPNCSLVIVRWSANQTTGTTHEYSLSWAER